MLILMALFILLVLALFYPFRFTLIIDEGRISLYFLATRLYHQHWRQTTETVTQTTWVYLKNDILHIEDIQYLKLMTVFKYQYMACDIALDRTDYARSSVIGGALIGLLFWIDTFLSNQGVPLTYHISYQELMRIRLQTKFDLQLFPFLRQFIQIRRDLHGRTSHT